MRRIGFAALTHVFPINLESFVDSPLVEEHVRHVGICGTGGTHVIVLFSEVERPLQNVERVVEPPHLPQCGAIEVQYACTSVLVLGIQSDRCTDSNDIMEVLEPVAL